MIFDWAVSSLTKQRMSFGQLGAQGVALSTKFPALSIALVERIAQPLNLGRIGVGVGKLYAI